MTIEFAADPKLEVNSNRLFSGLFEQIDSLCPLLNSESSKGVHIPVLKLEYL